MPRFILNRIAQSNGDQEVHNASKACMNMPAVENQTDLGTHETCHGAVAFARQQWPTNRINGCYYCSNACHTT